MENGENLEEEDQNNVGSNTGLNIHRCPKMPKLTLGGGIRKLLRIFLEATLPIQ